MRLIYAVAAVSAFFAGGSAYAQDAPNFEPGWRKLEGAEAGYTNSATLINCPTSLGDGYTLFRADVYSSSTDVSCGYRLGETESLISFYFYPAVGSVRDELNSTSKVILDRLAPGVTPSESERDWALPKGAVKAVVLEATANGGLGQSFALVDIAGRRLKARETWEANPDVSHRVADRFFALQAQAIDNAQACASLPVWSARRKARVSGDPLMAAMTGILILGMVPTTPTPNQDSPKRCNIGSIGSSDNGASLILSRIGDNGVQIALDNQPEGSFIAAITSISFEPGAKLPGDSQHFLYGQEGRDVAVFRGYRNLPSWEQALTDMVSVATAKLMPLAMTKPKEGEDGAAMSLNADEIEAEKAKRRPGSE
jgi:hypothetical protein